MLNPKFEKIVLRSENFERKVYYNHQGMQVAVVEFHKGRFPLYEMHIPCEGSGYRFVCYSQRVVDKVVKWQHTEIGKLWAKVAFTVANRKFAPRGKIT